jgi:hypothetical protein
MKNFRFPLDQALRLRRSQFDVERAHSERLALQFARIRQTGLDLKAGATGVRAWIPENAPIDSAALATMPHFQQRVRDHLARLAEEQKHVESLLAAQQLKTMEAARAVKLLEKLREQRWNEWSAAVQLEQENFASEAFLARWNNEKDDRAQP